jgi:hypothetical protein
MGWEMAGRFRTSQMNVQVHILGGGEVLLIVTLC